MQQNVRFHGPPWLKLGIALAMVLTVGMSTASAQVNPDPATLQMSGTLQGTLDPVQLGNTSMVTVLQNAGGADMLNTPWLLILGIPDTTHTTATIMSGTTGVPINAVNGGNDITTMTATAPKGVSNDAYSLLQAVQGQSLGLVTPDLKNNPLDNSNNWTNWSGADASINGIKASSFGLFEYQIQGTLLAKGTVNLQFDSLPVGTFVIAFGLTGPDKNGNYTPYDTPFTESGLETGTNTVVPAPPGLALVLSGCGAFGMFSLVRRRKLIAHAA